jgi:hypothetical protein
MERVAGVATVSCRISKGADDLEDSMIEPGQPCVITNGSAPGWRDRT